MTSQRMRSMHDQGRKPSETRSSHMGLGAVAIVASLTASTSAIAQSAAPGASALDEIVVVAPRSVLDRRIDSLPGGADLVVTEDRASTANPTVARALAGVPGVVVQEFFGGNDQPRIQIRGSGLQQNPVERGVLVLQDGLPINRADGSYAVGLTDPARAATIEVYRGYLANRLGATVLGGALNFTSPTGRGAPGAMLVADGGSFGQFAAHGRFGGADEDTDLLVQADASRRDGYRVYNASYRASASANAGLRLSDTVGIRFFASYTDLGFDVSGPLTAELLRSDPRSVFAGPVAVPGGAINPGPNVIRDRPRREAGQLLLGSRATAGFGPHLLDLALGYSWTRDSFRFPISSGVRDTTGDDVTGVLRYAYKPDAASALPLFEATGQFAMGTADRTYSLNLAGARGAQFGANRLSAETLSVNAGFNLPLGAFTLSPSLAYARASRDNADRYVLATRPTAAYNPASPSTPLPGGAVPMAGTGYARDYEGWSPALALSWRPGGKQLLFAAVSRSFEPPTHDDLLATVNGTPNSSAGRPNPASPTLPAAVFATPDLEAQRATTLEAGWRGRAGVLSWDVTGYYSWIDAELLSLRDASGVPLGAVNAGHTRHFGLELALAVQLTPRLVIHFVYNYQDFRFRDDPMRGDNRLAGAPRQLLHAQADYRLARGWSLAANVRWTIERTPADNLNTLFARPYAVLDLRSDFRVDETVSIFGEVTNAFDATYASSTLIVDQARPDQAVFLPGDGRAFRLGVKLAF